MKKTKAENLQVKAEEYRNEADDRCLMANGDAEREAIEAFESKSEIAQYFRENAAYVTGLVVRRLEAAQAGKPTFPLRIFDGETLVRLLIYETKTEYEEQDYDRGLSDEVLVEAWEKDELIHGGYVTEARTPTTGMQDALFAALCRYARAAAVFAKKIGSASLLDWAGMIDILENRAGYHDSVPLKLDDAKRLIALEKSAADRLRLDKIIADLPSARPTRKKAK